MYPNEEEVLLFDDVRIMCTVTNPDTEELYFWMVRYKVADPYGNIIAGTPEVGPFACPFCVIGIRPGKTEKNVTLFWVDLPGDAPYGLYSVKLLGVDELGKGEKKIRKDTTFRVVECKEEYHCPSYADCIFGRCVGEPTPAPTPAPTPLPGFEIPAGLGAAGIAAYFVAKHRKKE